MKVWCGVCPPPYEASPWGQTEVLRTMGHDWDVDIFNLIGMGETKIADSLKELLLQLRGKVNARASLL